MFSAVFIQLLALAQPVLDWQGLRGRPGLMPENTMPAFFSSVDAPEFSLLTQETVNEAHTLGIKIIPWSVSTKEDIERMISWDVNGIIKDYPDLKGAVIRQVNRMT
jgi:glycerophosphoryl diester phosphodiesterase